MYGIPAHVNIHHMGIKRRNENESPATISICLAEMRAWQSKHVLGFGAAKNLRGLLEIGGS